MCGIFFLSAQKSIPLYCGLNSSINKSVPKFLSVWNGEIRVKGIKCILYLKKGRAREQLRGRKRGQKQEHCTRFQLQLTVGSETLLARESIYNRQHAVNLKSKRIQLSREQQQKIASGSPTADRWVWVRVRGKVAQDPRTNTGKNRCVA